jgi:hypothetical protein
MEKWLHITGGDISGELIRASGLPGEVLVIHEILYEGVRTPGWPNESTLLTRARFLEKHTDGGIPFDQLLAMLHAQYAKIQSAKDFDQTILWFDACLFDQAMLAHILACFKENTPPSLSLICIDAFPSIEPFDGLGQLNAEQIRSLIDLKSSVTTKQLEYAEKVDHAFALQDPQALLVLSRNPDPPLPFMPSAIQRWLEEQSTPEQPFGKLEQLILQAIEHGYHRPMDIFHEIRRHECHPIYWGDSMLWEKINQLQERHPTVVKIQGPSPRLPQWGPKEALDSYLVTRV